MTSILGFPLVRRTMIFACALTFSYAGAVMSQDGSRPVVELAQEGVFIEAPALTNLTVMNVRVYDQAGELVFSWQSLGEPVTILPRDLPDGVYSYESVAVFDDGGPEQERTVKSYGDFRVDGGLVLPGMEDDQAHVQPVKPGIGYRLLGAVLDWLVSDAAAIDLTAEDSPSADVYLHDSADPAGPYAKWILSYDHDDFKMWDFYSSNLIQEVILPFRVDSNTNNHLSFDVRPDGDVSLGDGRFWVERSTGDVGIGTTAPNSSLHISAGVPRIRLFDESNSHLGAIVFNDDIFALEGNSFQDVIRFRFDAPADSMFVNSNGDVALAGQKVFIGKTASPFNTARIGVGTTSPTATIEISEPVPAFRLTDTSTGDRAELKFDTNTLSLSALRSGSTYRILHMSHDAPANSIVVNSSGNVAMGTLTPDAPLHVFRNDGTQEFIFLESNAAGGAQDRAMMQLNNNGGIRFQFDNTTTGNAWRFQAGTGNQDNFEITKVGSGELELVLQNDGDLIIAGSLTQNSDVNAKRDIEAVDGQMLLAKLDSLPVAEWTYKRDSSGARHLGPMAQDFHAAFGLGEDETKIAPGDMAGVNMAAIKALRKELQVKNAELAALQQEKDAELAEVKNRLARLESLIKGLNKPFAGL